MEHHVRFGSPRVHQTHINRQPQLLHFRLPLQNDQHVNPSRLWNLKETSHDTVHVGHRHEQNEILKDLNSNHKGRQRRRGSSMICTNVTFGNNKNLSTSPADLHTPTIIDRILINDCGRQQRVLRLIAKAHETIFTFIVPPIFARIRSPWSVGH
jgi:hypothetical protein